MTTYVLNIAEYPQATGFPCPCVTSTHATMGEAVAALDRHDRPYHIAYVQWQDGYGGGALATPEGLPTSGNDYFRRMGANGEHPARTALRADLPRVLAEVVSRYRTGDNRRGMVDLAREVLAEFGHDQAAQAAVIVGEMAAHRMQGTASPNVI